MTTKKRRKLLALCLSLAMLFSVTPLQVTPVQPVKAASYGISNPRTDENGVSTWDCVTFGNYWQNDTDGDGTADGNDEKEPIKWRVLSVNGDDAFLLADKNLDCQPYNTEFTDVTWETCTLRNWLNSDFYNAAFSDTEKSAIKTTTVINEDNPNYGTEGGNDTEDKIYLLSIGEATNSSYGFSSDGDDSETREAVNTMYVADAGEIDNDDYMSSAGNTEYRWWLRSPGLYSNNAVNVDFLGSVGRNGSYVNRDRFYVVRPVLHLNLSSNKWSKAGTVCAAGGSSGGSAETEKPTEAPKPTSEPAETEKPTESPKPTSEPAETENPTTSPKPTNKPAETEKPTVSPKQTGKPIISPKPTNEPIKVTAPAGVKKLTAKNKKKKSVVLSWKTVSGAKGYQLQYAMNKKFTKKKKSKLTAKAKFTVKKLKKKRTYYFRVRAYKLNGKTKVYGKWSKVKKVKVKK